MNTLIAVTPTGYSYKKKYLDITKREKFANAFECAKFIKDSNHKKATVLDELNDNNEGITLLEVELIKLKHKCHFDKFKIQLSRPFDYTEEVLEEVTVFGRKCSVPQGYYITTTLAGLVVAFSHKPHYLENLDRWVPNETKVISKVLFDNATAGNLNLMQVFGKRPRTKTQFEINYLHLSNLAVGESCLFKDRPFGAVEFCSFHPDFWDNTYKLREVSKYVQEVTRIS